MIQLGLGIAILAGCFVSYIDKQNTLAYLQMRIPKIAQEIREVEEEIAELQYDIDQFQSPSNLLEIAQKPEFSHLKHPFMRDILSIEEGYALNVQTMN